MIFEKNSILDILLGSDYVSGFQLNISVHPVVKI